MVEIKYVDISEYSFDEFVSFFFDRPVLPKKKAEEYDPWHFHLSVT
jgi:hypothetical protein